MNRLLALLLLISLSAAAQELIFRDGFENLPPAECRSRALTVQVASIVGAGGVAAEWPGGSEVLAFERGCFLSVARPSGDIAADGDGFVVTDFVGFESCYGDGGEDGDGCIAPTCPTGEIGSCESGRPQCPSGGEGAGDAIFRIRCNGSDTVPIGFIDNLLVKEQLGEWTREEGIIASLRWIAGEVDTEDMLRHPELVVDEATGILEMANEYLAEGSDPDAQTEIARLLGEIVFTDEQLQAMAGGVASAPSASGVAGSTEEDCARFYPPDSVPPGIGACILQEAFMAGDKQFRIYLPAPPLPSGGLVGRDPRQVGSRGDPGFGRGLSGLQPEPGSHDVARLRRADGPRR